MDIEVIHDEGNRLGEGILLDDVPNHASKLGGATVGCRRGEMPTGLRLDNAKCVRHAAPLIFVVLLGRLAWFGRYRRSARRRHPPTVPPTGDPAASRSLLSCLNCAS